MGWYEQSIRRYEHRRWTVDDNRRVLPFSWCLEHLGGLANESDPRAFLDHWTNYRERFLLDGSPVLPDELWVGDEHAGLNLLR